MLFRSPKDFWSQSLCWGSLPLGGDGVSSVRVRFRNDGERNYARGEAHLVYRTKGADETKVTFAWKDDKGVREASHVFAAEGPDKDAAWTVPTGKDAQTRWVEFAPVAPQ